MTLIGKTSHSLFFNGISDSVVCPSHEFASTGIKTTIGGDEVRSSRPVLGERSEEGSSSSSTAMVSSFSVEAWIRPDCGGVIASKEGMFKLSVGSVGAPAPAVFSVTTRTKTGDVRVFTARSAQTISDSYSGIIYPTAGQSFIENNTELSKGGRELLHVVGMFNERRVSIFVNGQIVASNNISTGSMCMLTNSDLYLGGKGGEFRGYIEGVHLRLGVDEDSVIPAPIVRQSSTVGLWRFEEPVEVEDTEFYIKSGVNAGDTVLTLDTTQVQELYELISGESITMPSSYTVPSLGNYQVGVTTHSDGAKKVEIAHTSINLLINPTGTDIKTGKPNSKAPERVRLKSISSSGSITVESIHLDFDVSTDTGSRGVLHDRTAFDNTSNLAHDSLIVILRSDLLLDPGTGRPMQPPGLGSQAIDRNGMTVIDESGNGFHGFLHSRTMSINKSGNPYTVSNANWTIDTKFQVGHSGRHKFSHCSGHPYLRMLPRASKERVTQTVDGLSDSIYAVFDGQSINLPEQVPINSQISLLKSNSLLDGTRVITTGVISQIKRNGLSTLDPDRDEIISIGGSGFNITPFLLKSHATSGVEATDDVYNLHLAPEIESRVAILQTGDTDFPYVEIHYNAIDLTGGTIGANGPALLVSKTVPSGGSVINTKRVADRINTLLGSGTMTLHAPGGIIHVKASRVAEMDTLFKDHNLAGDNTGGRQYEVELDLSMTPPNYTPQVATDPPNSPPIGVDSSHANDSSHPSVYHHLVLRDNGAAAKSIPDDSDDFRLTAKTGNKGPTNQSTHAFEMFDVIDNYSDNKGVNIIVHPTDRSRNLQLSKFTNDINDPSLFSLEFLMSRGRVSSFRSERTERGLILTMQGRGLMDDVAAMASEYIGEGSPDSIIVKESRPDAPVVTVTLGGPGQGAVETTPTWDKSPLTRLGWNTRRDGGARVTDSSSTSLTVTPLNNNSDALASWGTYMFPVRGRIHLENGASAEYYDTTATAFTIKSGDQSGTGRFINGDGSEQDTFANWLTANSVVKGQTNVLLDPLFDEASVVSDGTTINDRLFQSIGSVAHDYQLGTQYASTRALVEIPVFGNQFFDDPRNGVFPGPDNSMKIHLDPTLTAHSWAPNPVGRRAMGISPADRDVLGPYHKRWIENTTKSAVVVTKMDCASSGYKIYFDDLSKSFPAFEEAISSFRDITGVQKAGTNAGVAEVANTIMHRRIYTPEGEWAIVESNSGSEYVTVNNPLSTGTSEHFWKNFSEGGIVSNIVSGSYGEPLRGDPALESTENEFRRPYYYDRANVQTQGGNIDYGLRQYVSAVEFKEGPTANPHAKKIESGAATFEIISWSSPNAGYISDNLPSFTGSSWTDTTMEAINQDDEILLFTHHTDGDKIVVSSGTPAVGDIYTLKRLKFSQNNLGITTTNYFDIHDGYGVGEQSWKNTLNKTWNNPYAPGGLRHGDTVWMNMHYTNPHAIEGLFCKSRGVLNEFLVWNGFNGGRGELGTQARDSIPLENFLIGNTCMETAQNFVQHVNKTVELNWLELGYSASEVPVVAYLDPYLAKEGHARVLLYDVAHDREFIAFHDIHMQVQTGQATPKVNGLDIANGFYSQDKHRNNSSQTSGGAAIIEQSDFIEGAYAHKSSPYMEVTTSGQTHNAYGMNDATIFYGSSFLGSTGRTENSTVRTEDLTYGVNYTEKRHQLETATTNRSTFFDTPDGTRAIPAFLCLKGNRANTLDLTTHSESRLQHLPQWKDMDFVRRLTLDLGEIGQADGVSNTESAVREMVRRVNQAAALQGRSVGGSTHDPATFWDDTAFNGDKGSHMGYLRAHFGRAVKDLDGNDGYTIVIHSTVPGASGRNFCAWLDNSKGQAEYRPQFLVGHGGRFRSFWAMPMEGEDENMHPAPMPITKNGRPFAPITTLRQMVPPDDEDEEFINNLADYEGTNTRRNSEMATGRGANTVYQESFESQGDANRMVEGLRTGTRARARINFGGLVASGVPGWAPDAGSMGFGILNKGGRFDKIYNDDSNTTYSTYVTTDEQSKDEVGKGELYGFRFTDHRDKDHTIRLVYREKGQSFANNNTVLPPGLENEIIISFDDRDIGKGGFTVGKHMKGSTYPVTIDAGEDSVGDDITTSVTWRGNSWNGIKAPSAGYPVSTASVSGSNLSITLSNIWYTDASTATSLDYLGLLGFPEEGLFIYTDNHSSSQTTKVFRYTSRSHKSAASDANGTMSTHSFYGVTGGTLDTSNMSAEYATISPMLNWTTIVTDELIAAAVEYAMGVDPNTASEFDCSKLYGPDGRTYKEWMGDAATTAIQIHTLNDKKKVTPLGDLFSVSREIDLGLYAGNAETYLTSTQVDDGVVVDTGYLPKTLLNITSKFRGENANTVSPTFIKSNGDSLSTSDWKKHLRGEKFTAYAGDHITPCINNVIVKVTSVSGTTITVTPWQLLTPYDPAIAALDNYFSELYTLYDPNGKWATYQLVPAGNNDSGGKLELVNKHSDFSIAQNNHLSTWGPEKDPRAREFAGHRLTGNTYGEPLTYFRGAHDSPDHSVPLYFGGGFSGVVMDINDGTQNDYTEFYSHPYASGPTGCAGLQNVGENMGAHAILDTTAMLAMFPGTPFLNQHRGESQPPFTNADALLAPDMNVKSGSGSNLAGNTTQLVGYDNDSDKATRYKDDGSDVDNQTTITHPTPIVLRFAHPYARYTDAASGCADEVAYIVFGPGQSVPKNIQMYASSGVKEPTALKTVSAKFTHVYHNDLGGISLRGSGTEPGKYHPNEMSKGWKNSGTYTDRAGLFKPYLPPTMSWQRSAEYPYGVLRNWEPACGTPSEWLNTEFDSSSASLITNHWASSKATASLTIAHPMFTQTTADALYYHWHMDGGYPAGGNWMDNAIAKNPTHPTTGNRLPDNQEHSINSEDITLGLNASMFRVGALALEDYDRGLTENTTGDGTTRDVFVVDATRVQNSEELATIISAAINSYPGEGNLKAMGGTFLPSFQDAIRQDRYAWINVGMVKDSGYSNGTTLTTDERLPKYLPEKGWLRVSKTGTGVFYGRYTAHDDDASGEGTFTIGTNWRSGGARLESPTIGSGTTAGNHDAAAIDDSWTIYVWSKTGNLRWSNGAPEALHTADASTSNWDTNVFHHLAATQVHFNGFVDAIDRTRPVGAVGWHGERYSYLNSLKVAKTTTGHGISAGLGAWHPLLGFNPYGSAMGVHALNGATAAYAQAGATASFTQDSTGLNSGLHPRHYVVVSNEAELPIIAKADRDGLLLCGDMLDKRWAASSKTGGTVIASHNARHNNDRFAAYAHGGPHVDAQFAKDFAAPSSSNGEWAANIPTAGELYPMESCLFPTGDLFYDRLENPGVAHYPQEDPINHNDIGSNTLAAQSAVLAAPYSFWKGKSAARNFFTNHVVWKRMDGGNLCMPASNARGLGAVPWVWRKVGNSYVKFGETIYGNTRFSFETTNAAVFPTVQAQELAHPQLAEKYPVEIGAALSIPNEEIQFEAITVVDDSGQEHKIEGGSPLGTVIRDFSRVGGRDIQGPALSGSGNEPNLSINLPDPNTIPGNILVRSGFDKVQAYQHETMGAGGLQRPDLPDAVVSSNFDSTNENPSTNPFWENEGWERVDNSETSEVGTGFPYSKSGSMDDKAPLQTSYEPHDRALYFHLTKMGWGYTEREPLGIVSATTNGVTTNTMTHNPLTFVSVSGSVLTASGTITAPIWQAEQTPDGRSFLTVNGHVVSFTGVSGSTFTGCKFTPGFTATNGNMMKPSFYVPAGSTRHFAARRLRDHAEVSGESPDKAPIDWVGVDVDASPATAIRDDRLTPMPIPRMGHHYVTPTMAVMPGHLSHPLYQRVYNLNRAYQGATTSIEQAQWYTSVENSLIGLDNGSLLEEEGVGVNALMWFSSPSSPHPPSDIHGGAFTLMVETKVRYDGYGILAFDAENNSGDHRLKLEAGTNYSTHWNFPDPLETGAYQIIIQPNLFAQQLMGFSTNYDFGADSSTQYPLLTDQQVATVIALQWNGTTYDFVLAEALKADVRGCEVYLNEVILDIDPSPNQQFTSLPTLALYNPLGVNESTSPAWSRKSLPYYPGMFQLASPGYTLTVPWWSPAYTTASGTLTNGVFAGVNTDTQGNSYNWRNTEQYHPNHYYHFSRTGYGSVGAQSVMTGYPTHYLNPYLHSYESLNPSCVIKYADDGNDQILVDNNNLFPEVSFVYDDCMLTVIDPDGGTYEANYGYRGQASGEENATTNRFYQVNGSTQFWAACIEGRRLTLTGTTRKPGEVYTDKLSSVAAHHIQDLRAGTGDTGTSHLPDAYLSMWHYNLGRPMTYYSDNRASATAAAVDKKPYNHLPEHYETVHYHDFGYVASDGPFDFRGYGWDDDGANIVTPNSMGTGSGDWFPQARTANSLYYHYGAFWPGGSRFGAQASRMDLWGTAGPGWGRFWDSDHIIQEQSTATQFRYDSASGITDSISSVNHKRNAAFGFRFCVRGPFNRPRAALWSAQGFDDTYDNEHAGYRFGPYVQNDAVTAAIYTPATNANTSTAGTESIASGYSGIIERLTNASALIGSDLKGQQVKYSHGRRMCRPFGCAVRNIVNDPYAIRHHQGDYVAGAASADTDITNRRRDLATALAHYMTDWWGNTTGEDVRRLPVRGFGIRPAWDPEDAYRATDRTRNAQVFAAPSGHGKARVTLDLFDPATAKRVGDRGDGRGVRWPTVFNEDVLQEVDTIMDATGLVLSSNTAEPPLGNGYTRARNDDLQLNEVPRGISRRLDVHADDGLLKPEAMAGSNVEKAANDLLPASEVLQEPISRIAPRIGLDTLTIGESTGGIANTHVALGTEAHSLHTDRVAGRRYTLSGGIRTNDAYSKPLADYDLSSLSFVQKDGPSGSSNVPHFVQVMRLNYTHGLWPLGGNLIMDLRNYTEPVDDENWGTHFQGRNNYWSANPYETTSHNADTTRTNNSDYSIKFLLRPVRVLDHRHLEIFRDRFTNALSATAAGRYGVFTYDTPNARATTGGFFLRGTNPAPDNPPYPPAYHFLNDTVVDNTISTETKDYRLPISVGPIIPGTEASGFTNSLKQTVARITVADNTLQHLRADASRRGDFTVQPRYTQSLYPGTNLNKSDHSGESSHTDNEVDG